jgi:hypothetical protein
MIINNNIPENQENGIDYVRPQLNDHVNVITNDFMNNQNPRQHDSDKLAKIILSLC